ncbi:MAG: Ig-like domain-containing protein [bacterium]
MSRICFAAPLAVCAAFANGMDAAPLRLTAPEPGTTVQDEVRLTAAWDDQPDGATVSYVLNDRYPLIEGLNEPPFTHPWQTREIMARSNTVLDGPMQLRVVGRNAQSEVIARSELIEIKVDNPPMDDPPPGTLPTPSGSTIRIISPDLNETLSGTVEWTVEADREPFPEENTDALRRMVERKPIETILLFIDGRLMHQRFGAKRISYELDTTTMANGEHELLATAWAFSRAEEVKGVPPVAMIQRVVRVDNGHALQQVRPRWGELHLQPDEAASLQPMAHYTDGVVEPWSGEIYFESDNPDVATVNEAGQVTAKAPGTTRITLRRTPHEPNEEERRKIRRQITWKAERNASHAWVRVSEGDTQPHLARDGAVLETYDPNRSLWVRSMFRLAPRFIGDDPELAEHAKQAGINTLESGLYVNPVHIGNKSFDHWKKYWGNLWQRSIETVEAHDFAWLTTGDDICRTARELHNTLTNPWSKDAIQHAFRRAGESDRVVGVEMVDEVSMMWGETPQPETDDRWQNKEPAIPSDAFLQLMTMIRDVSGAPPITWPVLGLSKPEHYKDWNEDPFFADYYSHYWTYMDWRKAYPWGGSAWQTGKDMRDTLWLRRAAVDIRKPELMLVSVCGPMYRKEVDGDRYTPGRDVKIGSGVRAHLVPLQIMLAACEGAMGVRSYSYDGPWMQQRERSTIGSGHQIGAAPIGPGVERWRAMSAAFNVLQAVEPALLQPSMHALDLGPWIETGARQGPFGRLLIAVNLSEMPVQRTVDLQPYLYDEQTPVQRYRVAGTRSQQERIVGPTEQLRFAPGESVIWHIEPPTP